MKHRKLFISLSAVFSAVLFLAIFLSVWYLGDVYPDFKRAEAEFEIPGLDDGATPQGMSSCYANYTVETVKQEISEDDDGNQTVKDVVTKETKMQPYFFISAYMADGSPSRIYVVGQETGYVGYVTMKTVDGSNFYGHSCGIAINNYTNSAGTAISSAEYARYYTLWVTCDSTVYCAKSSDAYATAKKSIAQEIVEKAARIKLTPETPDEDYDFSIKFTTSFKANCNASFCYYYDNPGVGGYTINITSDRLYIGEFYNGGKYETDDAHKMTTPNGYKNTALMYEYKVHYKGEYGLTTLDSKESDTDPVRESDKVPAIANIYSIPEKIQGVAWSGRDTYGSNNGILVLSQSYGLSNSRLLCFDYSKIMKNANRKYYKDINEKVSFVYDGVKRVSGKNYTDPNLYVYFVDKANEEMFIDDLSVPSMSEGLCNVTPPEMSGSEMGRTKFYILFESGAKKYKTFVRRSIKNVYSMRFDRLEK